MKTHFNLVSGAAILVAASFTVGLFGCSAENSMDSLHCFSYKCTDNDDDNAKSSSSYKKSSSSNKRNSSSSNRIPVACNHYVSSLLESPRCYPENYGETLYDEDTKLIFSCEPNMFTEEGYWSAHSNLTDCDEYVPSYSSSSFETGIYPSSSSQDITTEYGILVDSRDGNIYQTVTIGNQTWMAENLRYRYIQETAEEDSSCFCYSNDDGTTYDCDKYGRYYLWSAAMDSAGIFTNDGLGCGSGVICNPNYPVQGICPDGWHLPSEEEMTTLYLYTNSDNKGTSLRSSGKKKNTKSWYIDGTDEFGFNALASGIWTPPISSYKEGIYLEGFLTSFWTSSEHLDDDEAVSVLYLQIYEDDYTEDAGVDYERKWRGYPIRCVQN